MDEATIAAKPAPRKAGYVGGLMQRAPGVWSIRYTSGKGPDGKYRQRSGTFRGTKREAKLERARLEQLAAAGKQTDRSRLTLAEWFRQWHESRRPNLAAKTAERYAELFSTYLEPRLGTTPLQRLTAVDVQATFNELRDSGRIRRTDGKHPGLAPKTLRHLLVLLKSLLQAAVRAKLLSENVLAERKAIELPAVSRRGLPRALSRSQLAQLLDDLQRAPRLRWLLSIVRLAVLTGARPGEYLAARFCDVDLDRGELTIARTVSETRSAVTIKAGAKTDASVRVVSLSPFAVALLREHRDQIAERMAIRGRRFDPSWLLFFPECSAPDKPYAPSRVVGAAFNAWAKRNGHPVDLYGLRHTWATLALQAGIPMRTVSEMLGHASVTVTSDRYTNVLDEMRSTAALRMDEFLADAGHQPTPLERNPFTIRAQ